MIIKRQKTFARADYEGLDGIAREQLAKKRSQIAKDLLKQRGVINEKFADRMGQASDFAKDSALSRKIRGVTSTSAIKEAHMKASDARIGVHKEMLDRHFDRWSKVMDKRAQARATKNKIIGGVALGAAGLAAGAGYLYNKKKKSQTNQEADSK